MAQPIKKIVSFEKVISTEMMHFLAAITQELRTRLPFKEVSPEVFVYGMLEYKESLLYRVVSRFLNSDNINEIHDKIGEFIPKDLNARYDTECYISAKLRNVCSDAFNEASEMGLEVIYSDHILLALLKDYDVIAQEFAKYSCNYSNMKSISQSIHAEQLANEIKNVPRETPNTSSKKKSVIPNCVDLNEKAEKHCFDEYIGNEDIVQDIFLRLNRRKDNNVILVGESGVGKSEIVNHLATLINNGTAPIMFKDKTIWKFNPTEIIAGTSLRGMFEEKILALYNALSRDKNAILFIDDIHTFMNDKSKEDYNSGGCMGEIFANDDIPVIVTTTFKGLKSFEDSNAGLSKHMQKIIIPPSSEENTLKILNGVKEKYEAFHRVKYNNEVLKTLIRLTKRYVTDKSLPSSAIGLMDEVGSHCNINRDVVKALSQMQDKYNEMVKCYEDAVLNGSEEEIKSFDTQRDCVRKVLAINEENYRNADIIDITEENVCSVLSNHTNIPISKLNQTERNVLSNIEDSLKSSVIGQDEAIHLISNAIKRNKVGLLKNNGPIASFLLVGESGVGKTLLAKKIAEQVFGDEKYLTRFDMSEYNTEMSVNKLIGASAGYVGYNEGGLLIEAVKKNKHCVLLIDEIEKANEQVYNIFLQVLDEGFLTDNTGYKADFKNTIIIMTSNVGTKEAANNERVMGFGGGHSENKKKSILTKELKEKFPPEFLNRLDDVVYFNHLTDDNLKQIIRLELNNLQKRLNIINARIEEFNDDIIEFIFNSIQSEKSYGARPIIRSIRKNIEDKIVDCIISLSENEDEKVFTLAIDNNELIVSVNNGNQSSETEGDSTKE